MHNEDPTKPIEKKSWGPVSALLVTIGIYFVAQITGGILIGVLAVFLKHSDAAARSWLTDSVIGQFSFIALVEGLSVGLLYAFLKSRQLGFKAIGLIKRPRWLDVGYVFIGFGLYMLLNQVVLRLAEFGAPNLDESQKQSIGFENAHGSMLVLVFIALVVLPPVVEEMLMRGFLYTGLKHHLPKVAAALLTSVLFAIAHLELGSGNAPVWSAALDTFALSIVLIFLYEKTGRLWSSIGLHMLKNSIAFLYLFVLMK
jgi:membrane protease YdiL (CAAX protease family)